MKHILTIIHFVPKILLRKLQKTRCSCSVVFGGFGRMEKGEWFSPNIYLERLRKTTR